MFLLSRFDAVIRLGFICLVVLLAAVVGWVGLTSAQGGPEIKPLIAISAASFLADTPVAPGSIVAAFTKGVVQPGTYLVGTDSNPSTPEVELPLQLGNLNVEVQGRTASIFGIFGTAYGDQFNILLPNELLPGHSPILIKDVTGRILAAGEIEIAKVAPAFFTANSNGKGVAAGYIVRAHQDDSQMIEQATQYDQTIGAFVSRPIDLEREDERVFLILFLTGARRIVDRNETRVLIGGVELIPDYFGPSAYLGVDQINLRLPRTLAAGLTQIAFIDLAHGMTANNCEVVIAPPKSLIPPTIQRLNRDEALAGEVIEVTGTGFTPDSEVLISDSNRRSLNAMVMEVGATRLKVQIPFGVGSGRLIVRNARGEASIPCRIRTSMSGVVQRVERQTDGTVRRLGVGNATIRISQNNVDRMVMTNDDGAFLIPDVTSTNILTFEVDGTTSGVPSLAKEVRSLPIISGRDNQYQGYIELKEISAAISAVIFDPQGSSVKFPDGIPVDHLTLTVLDPGRVPANLPPGQYSSTIAQLTPFGGTLDPGGKLIFPNRDGYAANETVTLYRFDQTPGSATLGTFVAAGQAKVTADGERIETASNAIKQSTYYFVSKARKTITIYGRVIEEVSDGATQPARGALVQVRGQTVFSLADESGVFQLTNVAVPDATTLAEGLTIEVSFLRPDGTVDRAERAGAIPNTAGLTLVSPAIKLLSRSRSRAPILLAPHSLTIEAGKPAEFNFVASARVTGQTLTNVQVFGATFATIASLGENRYALRLSPNAEAVGIFNLELRAIDSQGERTSEMILLEVKAGGTNTPLAVSQSIETNEDQPVNLVLIGSNGDRYRIISEPRYGRLTGIAPNLVYQPVANFNGIDSFSFAVGNGNVESTPAFVTISVKNVADQPQLIVGDRFTVSNGQRLAITINGHDGDAGQRLTLTGTGRPLSELGATIRQTTATSWHLEWEPTGIQAGSYPIDLLLTDNGAPALTTTKTITLMTDSSWTPSVFLRSGSERPATVGSISLRINALIAFDDMIFAGTNGAGIYRSLDNGITWTGVNTGLDLDVGVYVVSLMRSGGGIFAGVQGKGIYRSADNGATWISIRNGLPTNNTDGTVISMTATNGIIFAGVYKGGVYRSIDNGTTWSATNTGLPLATIGSITSMAASGGAILAGTEQRGLYRSTDSGATWTLVIPVRANFTNRVSSLLISNGVALAGIEQEGLYRSTDNGATWVNVRPSGFLSLAVGEGAIFAGGGGIYRSTDGGQTWVEMDAGLPSNFDAQTVFTLAVNGGIVFAGTNGLGVYRSTDNGALWREANAGLPAGFTQSVTSLTATDGVVFAGTVEGAYRSTDKGITWNKVSDGLPDFPRSINALTSTGGVIYAGLTAGSGLYRSFDKGLSWSAVRDPILPGPFISSLAASGGTIYVGTIGLGCVRSLDNGLTWTGVGLGIPMTGTGAGPSVNPVISLTLNGVTAFAGTQSVGIYRLTGNGLTWSAANVGLPPGNARRVNALMANGGIVYAGTGAGIYRSMDNGGTWSEANVGLLASAILSLTANGGTIYAGVGGAGVYRSNDNGATWSAANSGLPALSVSSMVASEGRIYAGISGAGVFTLSESVAWEPRNNGLSNQTVTAALIEGETLLAGTSRGGVFRTLDNGLNWTAANTGLPPTARVQSFTYTSSGTFAALNGEGVYFSADQGVSWRARSNGLTNLRVKALANDGAMVWAGTDNGLFRSNDQGNSWAATNTGLTDLRVLSLSLSSNAIYAVTANGLFRSTDGGSSWAAINTGLGNLYIVSLGIAPDGNTLLAGTASGLYRSTNSGASWILINNGISDQVIPLTFSVSGNKLHAGTLFGYYISEDNGVSWRSSNSGLLSLQVSALAVKGNQVFVGTRMSGVFISRLE
jgi:photosystem II stability/assembly factor-like uncharacterized protein